MSDVPAHALSRGQLVAGRYRIEEPIGSGGMGVVYRAVQLPMERPVALKIVRRELSDAPHARARFEREARVASALTHPSAVIVHDFGEHEGRAFLAMELVHGESLRALVARGPLGVARAIELATQLADVLAASHAIGLVHRDLKPENVLLEASGRARVLDFGLAFREMPGPAGRMTREGVVVGTPDYLSPEQARGDEVGPPTDVYALGCLLHELVSGQPPFLGTEMEVLSKQMYAPAPPWGALDVPADLDTLRRAMLDKRAAQRPSAVAVRDRLAAMDPDPDRARARARQDGYLGPRAARMVDAAATRAASPSELEVGVIGEATPELLIGLGANGIAAFVVTDAEPIAPSTAALYAPGADEAQIHALRAHGLPVIADAARGDLKRLSALMRAGAADVALRPVSAAELAQKLTRVTR